MDLLCLYLNLKFSNVLLVVATYCLALLVGENIIYYIIFRLGSTLLIITSPTKTLSKNKIVIWIAF